MIINKTICFLDMIGRGIPPNVVSYTWDYDRKPLNFEPKGAEICEKNALFF